MSRAREMGVNIPDYSPDLFVNREVAIHLVVEKVRNISEGNPERKRLIVFWGYRGAGKTWLLRHLAETVLPQIPGVCPVYINLERFTNVPADDAIREIAGSIGQGIDRYRKAELGDTLSLPPAFAPAHWLVRYLEGALNMASATGVLVLLVDFVYEAAPELLDLLEKHVLGPLVVNPRVVIVMAGRGQPNLWRSFTLRSQVEDHELKPFAQPDYTEAQLQKQRPAVAQHAADIHSATQGYPLANVIIPYPLGQATADQMREMIDLLLEPIQNPDGSWPVERQYLEALCVLRTFDEERIPGLLNAYDPSLAPTGGWTLDKASEILRRLIRTNLVRWNSERSGWWIVDQAIRHLLEEYLRVVDPKRWRRCHEAAITLYRDWLKRYPEERERWEEEIAYHKSRLSGGGLRKDSDSRE